MSLISNLQVFTHAFFVQLCYSVLKDSHRREPKPLIERLFLLGTGSFSRRPRPGRHSRTARKGACPLFLPSGQTEPADEAVGRDAAGVHEARQATVAGIGTAAAEGAKADDGAAVDERGDIPGDIVRALGERMNAAVRPTALDVALRVDPQDEDVAVGALGVELLDVPAAGAGPSQSKQSPARVLPR